MPRPKKIKKKKSFMFTSKHQSENGIISLVIGLISVVSVIVCVIISYANRGDATKQLGGVGFFAAIGDILGIIAGSISLKERDVFLWVPRIGLWTNIVMLVVWALLIIFGLRGV